MPDSLLPELPPWPTATGDIIFLNAHQWDGLGKNLAALHLDLQILGAVIRQMATSNSQLALAITGATKSFMSMPRTLEDIQQQLTEAANAAEAAQAEHAVQVKASTDATDALIVLFKQHQSGLDPATAAAFEAQIARVAATTAALASETTELLAQTAETEAADDEEAPAEPPTTP